MKKISLLLLIVLSAAISNAQVANYSFAASSGTYTALAGPTNVYTGAWDDNAAVSVPLGFSFNFNGVAYTSVFVHPNGYLSFGSSTSGYVPISGGSAVAGVIAAWGRDLQSQNTAPLGSVDYLSTGGVFTVQWSNTRRYISTTINTERFEMQIQLFQTSNIIRLVYGTWSDAISATTVFVGEVGLRGTSGTDFKNLSVLSGGNWASPSAGAVNTATCFYNETSPATKPAPGQTYTFSPPPPCVAPAGQATGLGLTAISTSQINGSFTATAADGYLVVRYPAGNATTAPANGTTYTAGNALGTGTVVTSGTGITFNAAGLSPSTSYDFYVYSYNNLICTGGPAYNATAPLSASQTTLACSPLAAGTYSVGPTGTYASLTAVTTAISGGTSGPVIFELQSTYNSAVETFPVTFPFGACPIAGVVVRPETGATGLVITSANATATIDLNGANYLTIDGRPGGTGVTSQLTISNTATGTAVAVRLINDASNNTITYCSLLGSTSTTFGVVTFSTGAVTGNDGNTISNNTISSAGANLPLNGIYSLGTSAAIDNSGNTVTNNNISDYFNAASITNGINILGNNSTWTVTNNRLFQTATRLYTTAQTHNGINITSGSGYTIIGNTIGFANSTGTGTTNMVGNSVALTGTFPSAYTTTGTANATRYIGINCAFAAGGAVSNIQNNIIAGFALFTSSGATTTNGIFCGIAVTSGNVNIGTATGNTIGATSGNGSIYAATTTTGGMIAGIYVSSANTVNIRNNSIGAIDAMGTTATICGAINGINLAGTSASYDISGNTIGNSTNPNLRMGNLTTGANLSNVGTTFGTASGTAIFNGILNALTTTGTIGTAVLPNTIRNASLNTSNAASASFRGITSSGSPIISNNIINNLTSANTNLTVASTLLAGMGIFLNSISTVGAVVRGNIISSLSLTNATTNGTNLCGIAIYAGATDLYANKIYDLINASTSVTAATPGTASGFFLRQPAGVMNIYNNMVSLGNGQTTNTSFNGIWQQNSVVAYTLNAYFNSFNIEGVAAAGAQPSFCLNRGSYSATQVLTPVSVLNNIFTNTRSGGTGKHYAIANNYAAAASATGWGANASNYNVLNATAATVGYWGADMTFAGWQAASASDVNSQSAVTINYVNTATGDLHIAGAPTPIEGTGTAVVLVTVDYDNQLRSAFSPTDIGADADNFFNYPVISYTPLPNICLTGARTLTATITDVDGVPTAGIGLPVLYWRINAGAYTAATSTSLGANQYQFSFGTGAAIGDVVSYYIVAQDNLGNAGSAPSLGAGGFTINPPAAGTPPTVPSSYTLLATLSGTYTVGAAGNYPTLTAAVNAYNTSCLGGPVVFSLIDATYPAETFPITINANASASAVNTLTIKPAVPTTISGSSATSIININGGDYVILDGSIGTTANTICPSSTASRDLTIQNTSVAAGTAGVWLNSATSPAADPVTNCTVKNCIVIGGLNSASTVAIGIGAQAIGTGGIDNDFNTIENNDLRQFRLGIYVAGAGSANKGESNTIFKNIMTSSGTASLSETGIFVAYENNLIVSGNEVDNIVRTASPDAVGINLGFGAVSGIGSTTAAIVDAIGNATVTFNKIGRIENSGTFAAAGLTLGNTVSGTQLIANNTISGVNANGTGLDFSVGLWIDGGTGTTNVHNNTVVMQGIQAGASTGTQTSTCLGIRALANPINISNNIFSNTQGGGAAGTTTRYAAVALGYASPYTGLISNYNDLYSAGAGPGAYTVGITGGVAAGTSRLTLANWQTETGGDAASQNVLPVFVSPTDLHLVNTVGTNWCLNGSGINIPAVTNDIDCQVRNNPPDMGADEFVTAGDAAATPASQTICSGTAIGAITYTGTGTTFNWTRDNVATVTGIPAGGTGSITGTLTNTTFAAITVTFTITPLNAGGCAGPTFTATVLVNPTPNAIATPPSQTACSGVAITTIALSGSATGTTYTWTRDNVATVTGIAASGAGNISGTLTNTTFAPITVTFTITPSANGCPGPTTTATVLVNPSPNAIATPGSQTVCSGLPITTIALSSSAAGTTYTWTRDNVAIVTGIAASGAGNISGTLTNTTFAPITVTFTITPTANGCTGPTSTATVLVNPSPNAIATPPAQSICSGFGITPIILTSSTAGTTYTWTRDNVAAVTGIAASGSGNIAGTLTNTTAAPVTVTFTITPTANGCTGTPTTATVLVNVPAAISAALTEPSTCVAADGAITLTLTGSGPYGFVWTGTGVNPNAQNQTGLAVGLYAVTVTDANGCVSTGSYTLLGPGGCTICPTITTLTTTPAAAVCLNQNTTITASALVNMGVTYGITFKYSLAPLPDPYTGGTVIATIPNGGLTSGGTVATTNTSFAVTGTYYIYAILSPVPIDPVCRPSNTTTLVVNPLPTITAGTVTAVCSGTTTALLPYTATQTPTTYSIVWSAAALGQGFVNVTNAALPASPVGLTVPAGAAPATYTGTISVTNGNGCTSVTAQPFSVTINPIPTVNVVANQTVCVGTTTTTTFAGTPAGVVFNWTNTNIAIGLAASGTGNISFVSTNATAAAITGTITVTPAYTNGGVTCFGTPRVFTITVNPTPTVNVIANQTVCNGASTAAVTFTGAVTGTVYNWTNNNATIGLAAAGTGNIASFVAVNATAAPVIATITVTPSYTNGGTTCTGTPRTFTITVNPTPNVNAVANQTVCNGAATTAVTFAGAVAGTVFNWTNNNATIGLAAAGTGNIASFTATNITNAPVTATITVTPTAAGCPGTPITFTITVNPTATVNAVANQALCNGSATAAVTFSGAVAGTVFNWTNNNATIGLAASGTGNIASFIATNITGAPVTATITVTPTAAGCAGTPVSFTITVNPTPTVNVIANQAVCNGASTAAVTFSGAVAGTVYNWTNNNTSIGLAAGGTGNIASFTAINNTTAPVVATITVTPTYTNGSVSCAGTPRTFTITVNSLPNIIFTNTPPRVCLTDTIVVLKAIPAGGVWSGRGVIGGTTFSAVAAGTGVSTIGYTVTNANGCTSTSYVNITVNDCQERHNVFANAIKIYPNPSNGQFNIRLLSDLYKEINIRVISASGQELRNYRFSGLIYGTVIPMDLRSLASGTYFLRVYNGQERAHFPFVIAK